MKRVLLAAVILGGGGLRVSAQSLTLPTFVWGATVATDWASTAVTLRRGNVEDNPTLKWAQGSPAGLVAFGAAEDAAGLWLMNKWMRRRHPKAMAVTLYALSGWRLFLGVHNFRLPDHGHP
jgi:hypothetical protein